MTPRIGNASIRGVFGGNGASAVASEQIARPSCQSSRAVQSGNHGRRKDPFARIWHRPDPRQWQLDELVTIAEAVMLIWPEGPVTASTLRTAIRNGELGHVVIAGRMFTTRRALEELGACAKRPPRKDTASAWDREKRRAEALDRRLATILDR